MKKIFFYLGIAAMALGLASCEPKEKIDWDKVTVNGFYVAGPATGSDEIKPDCVMAVGFNEVDKAVRDGMYEKYIVLEADKEFYLLYNDGNTKSRYSATLAQFNTPEEEAYADNPPSVMKGKLVIGDDAPAMKVAKTGLYHIVLDINKTGDLDAAGGAQILLLDASDFGVRGGMNGWGFTSADPKVTEFSNDGVTFNFKDQELGKGGEFKFATGNYWKVTLDDAGKVKAEVSLAAGMTLNGDNIKVDKGGLYDIALTFKLAQGSFDKSFSYTAVCTQESTAPETMYMNGGQWGGANWDWSADGIVELVPVWGAPGYFWCTRWFDGSQEFKFCAKKEWNGDFGDNGNNCKVPESGFYTVLVNGNENTVEIKPAEVYVIGLCGTAKTENQDVWDFNGADVLKLAADGQVLKGTLASSAELRIASKVHPAAPIDGVTTGNGWIDWWKTEFIFFDGKIAYRGAGNDQERVQGVAGKVLVLDFNNGTAALEDGAPAGDATSTFLAWLANPAADLTLSGDVDLTGKEVPAVEELTATLDGAGHAIKGISAPLFKKLSGTVKDLTLEGDVTLSLTEDDAEAGHPLATLALVSTGKVINVTNKANVSLKSTGIVGSPVVAGLVAFQSEGEFSGNKNFGTITLAHGGTANVAIDGFNRKPFSVVGGVVGVIVSATASDCHNEGTVSVGCTAVDKVSARHYVGGVIGTPQNAKVLKCTNKGAVTADFTDPAKSAAKQVWTGGIIGGRNGDEKTVDGAYVEECVNYGDITLVAENSVNNYLAGIGGQPTVEATGSNYTAGKETIQKIVNCHNHGKLTKKGAGGCRLGGICGGAATLENCTNDGEILVEGISTAGAVGGLVGYPTQTYHPVSGCSNTGKMTATCDVVFAFGGLFGQGGNTNQEYSNCSVNCEISAPASVLAGIILGTAKTLATDKSITYGTAEAPFKVAGTVNGTKLTADNYKDYLIGDKGTTAGGTIVVDNVVFGN